MSKKQLVILLILYLVTSGVAYAGFAALGKRGGTMVTTTDQGSTQPTAEPVAQLLNINPQEPKDQQCPLNGQMYTQTERQAWEKRRPLAVMIENSPDARPQSGTTRADVVFEAMAEGGVTRFMALYYCDVQREDITLAPIRSAREYFFKIASGFNRPLYVHVGGANTPGPADALGQIADAGWNQANDMNQFSIGYPTFVRDYSRLGADREIATEHTMVTTTEKLWKIADKRLWTNTSPPVTKTVKGVKQTTPGKDWKDGFTPWNFADGEPEKGSVGTISFEFWTGYNNYAVTWQYDSQTNTYKRILAGQPHLDLNTNQQIAVKNAVVMFAEEKGPIDEHKHLLYTLVNSTGDALVFQNGVAIKAKWSKKDREAPLLFLDEKGKPITFVRGPIWISLVGKKTPVTY